MNHEVNLSINLKYALAGKFSIFSNKLLCNPTDDKVSSQIKGLSLLPIKSALATNAFGAIASLAKKANSLSSGVQFTKDLLTCDLFLVTLVNIPSVVSFRTVYSIFSSIYGQYHRKN